MKTINKSAIKKILVINLAFIGDTILSTPVTRALAKEYPQAKLTMLTIPVAAAIAELNPYIDKVITYDKKGSHKGLVGMLKIAKQLRKEKFVMAVCLNFALRGAAVAWLAGIPLRIGYDAQHAGLFLTHTSSAIRDALWHESRNHLEVLRPLNIEPTDTTLALITRPQDATSLANKITAPALSKPYVVVCPFGSYDRKSLSMEKYVSIIQALSAGALIYLIGGAKEQADLLTIARQSGLPEQQVLAGTLTLPELTVLIAKATVMLTVDTGPLHIAQAVGTPVVALFGPTDPQVWGPRNDNDVLFYQESNCSPCWGKGECSANICLESLSTDKIAEAVEAIINKKLECK